MLWLELEHFIQSSVVPNNLKFPVVSYSPVDAAILLGVSRFVLMHFVQTNRVLFYSLDSSHKNYNVYEFYNYHSIKIL